MASRRPRAKTPSRRDKLNKKLRVFASPHEPHTIVPLGRGPRCLHRLVFLMLNNAGDHEDRWSRAELP